MKPLVREIQLLLTAKTPISHNDPAVQNDGNVLTFNRRRQKVTLNPIKHAPIHQHIIDEFCHNYPVTADIAPAFSGLKFHEFVSVALVRTMIDWHTGSNGGEGAGLFTGMTRYQMLERRLQTSAIGSHNLMGFWARATTALQLPIHPTAGDAELLRFWGLPETIQQQALSTITKDARAIVSMARIWHDAHASQDAEYAARKAKRTVDMFAEFTPQPEQIMSYTVNDTAPAQDFVLLEVPYVSSNSMRHQIREAAWIHLTHVLEIPASLPGNGPYPQALEAMFRNGGNLSGSEPLGATQLAANIRNTFPTLDLLGGCVNTFNLDQSRLDVVSELLCAENNHDYLPEWARQRSILQASAFELLDDVTQTRQAVNGLNQMIYNFETLIAGTELYLRLHLHPFTHPLTQGALLAAVQTWQAAQQRIAGKAAEGFSLVDIAVMDSVGIEGSVTDYEAYLLENADYLRAELKNGTLGSGSKTPLLT